MENWFKKRLVYCISEIWCQILNLFIWIPLFCLKNRVKYYFCFEFILTQFNSNFWIQSIVNLRVFLILYLYFRENDYLYDNMMIGKLFSCMLSDIFNFFNTLKMSSWKTNFFQFYWYLKYHTSDNNSFQNLKNIQSVRNAQNNKKTKDANIIKIWIPLQIILNIVNEIFIFILEPADKYNNNSIYNSFYNHHFHYYLSI